MRFDVSRDSFDSKRRLLRVVQEQGGLVIEADANEQTAILLHRLHTLAADLFGPAWGPAEGTGFEVTWDAGTSQYTISEGRYYVGGHLCEIAAGFTLAKQPDVPESLPISVPGADPFFFYLDVWERALPAAANVTGRDPGLEGMRPTPRTQLVCQVRVFPDEASKYDATYIPTLKRGEVLKATGEPKDNPAQQIVFATRDAAKAGKLRARPIARPDDAADPVELENQLYRVEIHRGGSATEAGKSITANCATYKWSRENGAVCFPIHQVDAWGGTTATVTLTGGFTDDRFALKVGDWVEYADDVTVLRPRSADAVGWVPNLFEVDTVGEDLPVIVTLKATVAGTYIPNTGKNTPPAPLLIRWDNGAVKKLEDKEPIPRREPVRADDDALVVLIPPSTPSKELDDDWLPLERGVAVQFVAATGQTFRRGDYWLIPARSATGAVMWPTDGKDDPQPLAEPPRETPHVFVALAATAKKDDTTVSDLRKVLNPDALVPGTSAPLFKKTP